MALDQWGPGGDFCRFEIEHVLQATFLAKNSILTKRPTRSDSLRFIPRASLRKESGQPSRTIEHVITEVSPGEVYTFYITNDTAWDPEVTLPELASPRISGDSKLRSVQIELEPGV